MANPQVLVATPARQPVVGGLLAAASVIDTSDEKLVAMGGRFDPMPCTFPSAAPGSCWALPALPTGTKDFGGVPQGETILHFPLYGAVECFMNPDTDYEALASESLTAGEGVVLEHVLYEWFVANAGAAVPAPGASVLGAVGLAEQLLSTSIPELGLIHMNRFIATLASQQYLLLPTGTTVQGTPVANGGGYVADLDAGYPTGAEQSELFITGGITIWRGGINTTTVNDPTKNRTMAIAERSYAVAIDCDFVKRISFAS